MRARIVHRGPFRSFVASVVLTYAAGALFVALPAVHRWVVLGAFVFAAVVPWLLMFARPGAKSVDEREGEVRIGSTTLRARDVTGASVAPDGHGARIACRGAR